MCSLILRARLCWRAVMAVPMLAVALSFFPVESARAIAFTPFGSAGQGGSANGQSLLVGAGGVVFELDAFLAVGTSGGLQLSVDSLPDGVSVDFSASLSADSSDLLLEYRIENQGLGFLETVRFSSFLDAEIDESLNGFFNESAVVLGALAPGQGFEVDDPFQGDLFSNLLAGTIDNTNAFASSEGDVAMSLSFELGSIGPSESAQIQIMISEDGDFVGPFAIEHFDGDPRSETRIAFSGLATSEAPIPEPSATALFLLGLLVIRLGWAT